jgi:hypothetical protein
MSFDLRLQITTLVSLNFSSTKFIILLDWLMEAMMKKKMFTYQLSTHHGVQTQEMLELCGFSSESIRNSRNGVPKQKNLCRKVKKASHRDLPDTD